MKSHALLITALFVLALAMLGCVGTNPNNAQPDVNFSLGNAFSAQPKNVYVSDGLRISIINFTDSRCPSGVECIWQGERGADLNVHVFDSNGREEFGGALHLGEITSRRVVLTSTGYDIELLSINTDTNTAELLVRKITTAPPADNNSLPENNTDSNVADNNSLTNGPTPDQNSSFLGNWLSVNPIQCNLNPWDYWYDANKSDANGAVISQEQKIAAWLDENIGVKVNDSSTHKLSGVTCEACNCPTGETVAVKVSFENTQKVRALGFSLTPPMPCLTDKNTCADGNIVGRVQPFCDFAKCPA